MLNIGAFGKTMAKSMCAVNSQSKETRQGRILNSPWRGKILEGKGGTLAYDFVKISKEKHEIEISNLVILFKFRRKNEISKNCKLHFGTEQKTSVKS